MNWWTPGRQSFCLQAGKEGKTYLVVVNLSSETDLPTCRGVEEVLIANTKVGRSRIEAVSPWDTSVSALALIMSK